LKPSERFWGLRDVSFRVAPGQMVGVVGRNGAGKSTLLRLIGGVGRPDQGNVKVKGRVGALLTLGAGFHPDLTGRENLFINGVIGGLTRREVEARLDSIIAFSELEDYIDSPLRAYSTGMQMRLAFSIAIHAQPDILLIDEMLAVGDLSFQRKCIERIAQLKSEGCAIVLVSHEAGMIQDLCDEALWLRAGQLAAHGPAEIVVDKYIAEADAETQHRAQVAQPGNLNVNADLLEDAGIKISRVRLLDSLGAPTAEIESGDPLLVEISYLAQRPVEAANFEVFIQRDDGVACCKMLTQTPVSSLANICGEGRVVLHIEQLNLNGGFYYIDVGMSERDWSFIYHYLPKVKSLRVRATEIDEGIIRPPHRWEVECRPAGESHPSSLIRS
jgi:lipopolysaccharide transport system ATP-binding protein